MARGVSVGPGKKVIIRFEGISPEDPGFDHKDTVGNNLLKTVIRQVNIDEHKCQYDWEEKSGTVVFVFEFKREAWADKVAKRAAGLGGAVVITQDYTPGK